MQNDLHPKGLEAAEAAWLATDMGLTWKLSDAIRAYISATVPAGDGEVLAWLHKRERELIAYAASFRGQEGSATIMAETMGRAKSLRYAADELLKSPLAASRLSQGTGDRKP